MAGQQNGCRRMAVLVVLLSLLWACRTVGGMEPAPSEYQIKALFLFNFTKYVDWPSNAFSRPDAPFIIGVVGESEVDEDLPPIIEGKIVNGRSLSFQRVTSAAEAQACHVLFIGASEERRIPEILETISHFPIVTVGETDRFLQQKGMINMIKKDKKVRLEINLNAARLAQVTISSRLLGVADAVLGKAEEGRD